MSDIRLARPEEYAEVGRVLQAAFTTGCWVTKAYHARLGAIAERAQTADVWVAVDEEGILGSVLTPKPGHTPGDAFTFNILGVAPRGRGLGLGARLVHHAVEVARNQGYDRIEIRSSPQMTAAHKLYYTYGFVRRHDWETSVVDSGQRLYAFTYRIPAAETPARNYTYKERTMVPYQPPGRHDQLGVFHPDPPRLPGVARLSDRTRYRLVTSLDSLRGRAGLAGRRLARAEEFIQIDPDPGVVTPLLFDAEDQLVSDDWRFLPRSILLATRAGRTRYPHQERDRTDALDAIIHTDLVEGLEKAIYGQSERARLAAQRIVYARLGDFDLRLTHSRYLLGEQLTEADLNLFAVLLGFDLEYRGQLGWGAASLVDYPSLWGYARGMLHRSRVVHQAELAAVGLVPGPDQVFAEPWGTPPEVEGINDVREAWWELDDREVARP